MTEEKKRHGCLTAWLVSGLFINSSALLAYAEKGFVMEALPDMPGWAVPMLTLLALFNLVCTVGLFKLKKWGFYGGCVSCGLIFVVNLSSGIPMAVAVSGPVGIILLYGVLQIGGDKSGWTQLD